jgi:hypothetical protein
MSGSWLPEDFPRLTESNHNITSDASPEYNCFSWAADATTQRWEPDQMDIYYWPPGVPREMNMEAFIQAYSTLGYNPCDTTKAEDGFEKILLYADDDGTPTHAAKQLPNGHWTSKIGDYEDIEHETPACVEGPVYGVSAICLKRRTRVN